MNAQSTLSYSNTDDHGETTTLTTDIKYRHTRVPKITHHETWLPDIISVSSTQLGAQKSIITKNNNHYLSTSTTFKHHQQIHSCTNHKKANWIKFTEETEIAFKYFQRCPLTYQHHSVSRQIPHSKMQNAYSM